MGDSGMMTSMMGIFMLLFWGAIIFGLVWAMRWLTGRGMAKKNDESRPTSIDILKQRYARGEIDREEFERMKKELES